MTTPKSALPEATGSREQTRFPDGKVQFTGTLRGNAVIGTIERAARGKKVMLGKLGPDRVHGARDDSYSSRAEFECAMILFRRY